MYLFEPNPQCFAKPYQSNLTVTLQPGPVHLSLVHCNCHVVLGTLIYVAGRCSCVILLF